MSRLVLTAAIATARSNPFESVAHVPIDAPCGQHNSLELLLNTKILTE